MVKPILQRFSEKRALNRFLENEGVKEDLDSIGLSTKGIKNIDQLNSSLDAVTKIKGALGDRESRAEKLLRESEEEAASAGVSPLEKIGKKIGLGSLKGQATKRIGEKLGLGKIQGQFTNGLGDPVRERISSALDPTREALGLTTKAERPAPLSQEIPEVGSGNALQQEADAIKQELFQPTGNARVDAARAIQERESLALEAEKRESAAIEVEKGVEAVRAKEADKALGDVVNMRVRIQNQADSFIDLADLAEREGNLKPGILAGIWSTVTGKLSLNEFFPGFEGGKIEVAAAGGRVSMEGARAVRLISIFQKTGLTAGMSTEQAARTAADSYRNALSTVFSKQIRDQSSDIDFGTKEGRDLFNSRVTSVDNALREIEENYRDSILLAAHRKNPNLVKPKTIREIKARWANQIGVENPELSDSEVISRVNTLVQGAE